MLRNICAKSFGSQRSIKWSLRLSLFYRGRHWLRECKYLVQCHTATDRIQAQASGSRGQHFSPQAGSCPRTEAVLTGPGPVKLTRYNVSTTCKL